VGHGAFLCHGSFIISSVPLEQFARSAARSNRLDEPDKMVMMNIAALAKVE